MKKKVNKDAKDELTVKDYFNSLNLAGWKISGNMRSGGQAETVEVRNKETNALGVFRVLRQQNLDDKRRFQRELEVLRTTPHSNIVEILEFPKNKNEYWYISRRGEQFKTFWDRKKKAFKSDPNGLLLEAVAIIEGISTGLALLHDKDIVHRDIKATNIVFNKGKPVLIDFGIVFVADEERLTSLDEAVANKYSHDLTHYFMEAVPKWLDVFLLSQLLIWMISERRQKNIERPLDWRFVRYDKLSENNLLKVLALTAKCSNHLSSPMDAGEFKVFLNTLFPRNEIGMATQPEIEKIKAIIHSHTTKQIVDNADAWIQIESRLPYFQVICDNLETQVKTLVNSLVSVHGIQISLREPSYFHDDFYKKIFEERDNLQDHVFVGFTYQLGDVIDKSFSFSIKYHCYTSIGIKNNPAYMFTENNPFISLHVYEDVGFKLNNEDVKLFDSFNIVPDASGKLQLYRVHNTELGHITVEEIVGKIFECITNERAWKVILA